VFCAHTHTVKWFTLPCTLFMYLHTEYCLLVSLYGNTVRSVALPPALCATYPPPVSKKHGCSVTPPHAVICNCNYCRHLILRRQRACKSGTVISGKHYMQYFIGPVCSWNGASVFLEWDQCAPGMGQALRLIFLLASSKGQIHSKRYTLDL